MLSTAHESVHLSDTQQIAPKRVGLASRKIWLPKPLYDGLPYFYLTAGFAAFFATLYIIDWFWVLPHYILFSAACVHFGIFIYRLRHRRGAQPNESDG